MADKKTKGYKPLFSAEFLSGYLLNFDLSTVSGIKKNREIISNWADTDESGKLDLMKEESIKSRFLLEIFGQLLGFNYKNTGKWLFQEEQRSKVGQTKPDGALGTFYISEDRIKSEVRIVIEVKNSSALLDDKQLRKTGISPVDQAFLYSTKMEGKCKWVVVTNLREIRFYRANDQSRYQRYLLTELLHEEKLKELLYLFHRDRLDNQLESTTEKLLVIHQKSLPREITNAHIIDELHLSLKRFEEMNFVSPRLIANLRPFNVLDNYVWHYSPSGKLFTLNFQIFELIRNLKYVQGELQIEPEYEKALISEQVIEYRKKLDFIFEKLYRSQIYAISALKSLETTKEEKKHTIGFSYRHPVPINAGNGAILKIKPKSVTDCDCLSCNYRSLDFRKLIGKVEKIEAQEDYNPLELAYGHYLISTDNHKRSYKILKDIEHDTKGVDKHILLHFAAKFNLLYHYNLFYDEGDGKKIRKELYNIDLDRLINNEIDIYVDKEVRKLLVDIKDDKLFKDAIHNCRETLQQIKEMKSLYERGGEMSGPNYPELIHDEYLKVYGHFQQNYLVRDVFSSYREYVELVFEAMLTSAQTIGAGLSIIREFYLTEAVIYASNSRVKELLARMGRIPMEREQKHIFLKKAEAFFSSYVNVGIFGNLSKNELIARQLHNWRFHDKFNDMFNNLCTLLSHIEPSREEFLPLSEPIVRFIAVDDDLRWWDVQQLGKLITSVDILNEKQLYDLLKSSIGPHRYPKGNKYKTLINDICQAMEKFHPGFLLTDEHTVRAAILSCHNEGIADLLPLAAIWKISSLENQRLLTLEFERQLDNNFNEDFYEHLLKQKIIPHDRKDYLFRLANEVNKFKVIGYTGMENGNAKFTHTVHINFLMIPYILNLDFGLPEFEVLDTLSPFESWLRNPLNFDYESFEPNWLLACNKFVHERLKGNQLIALSLEDNLRKSFDKKLAEIYFGYFAKT
ncbi:hypothetical protein GM921_00690 [Pedobacter sp. LMG 31464]|uniref:Uncharacterized protein n=1 Tax=Pedobacter planticolens TaxID=2679964 RepID=A0A923DUB3_9SPHI|nr:hypothetical protein [Pedobacter planticolens]MBB2143987.1 hypothetical protein [Pedobacter planticolens]